MIKELKGLSLKAKLTAIVVFLLFVVVEDLIGRYVVDPALQHISLVPVVIYNFLATAIVFLFLLAIVLAVWQSCRGGWHLVVKKERRQEIGEKIRQWPNSKWDVVWALAIAYSLLYMVLTVSVILVIPRERIAGVISPEEAARIMLFFLMPFLVLFLPLVARGVVQEFRATKKQWRSGTQRERIILVALATFVIVGYGAVLIGDYAGWDHLLWFSAA